MHAPVGQTLRRAPRAAGLVALGAAGALVLSACSGSDDASSSTADTKAAKVTVHPKDHAKQVTPGRAISVTADGGELTDVQVSDAHGKTVDGHTADGGTKWTSTDRTGPNARYTVTTHATSSTGKKTTHTSHFRTLHAEHVNKVTMSPAKGTTVGVGMPVSIKFDDPVGNKAAVEKKLKVRTNNHTQGSWGWVKDQSGADRIDWRPKEYWKSGTKVQLDAPISGVDSGDGHYFVRDYSTHFTVGSKRVSTVNVAAHHMVVKDGGKKVKSVPISAGSEKHATWSGKHVVYGKKASETLDSRTVGLGDAYKMKDTPSVVHLTFSGTFLHAAPWNSQIGQVNTSHGCVGMESADAKWFFDSTKIGDIVRVTGSNERTVDVGNGYGDWNPSWSQWQQRSAL